MFKVFSMRNQNGLYINKFCLNIKQLLDELGLSYLWTVESVTKHHIEIITQRIHDHYLQSWYTEINRSNKLETYRRFKVNFEFETYLSHVTNINHMKALSRFRCSAHKLLIEEGRFRNISRNDRICNRCNQGQIENEYHFLLCCPFYRELRLNCLPKYYCSWPTVVKFNLLMKSHSRKLLQQLSKFIFLAFQMRDLM